MNYCGSIVYSEFKDKLRLDAKSHADDLITYQVVNQTSIKLITIAWLNNNADISLNFFI